MCLKSKNKPNCRVPRCRVISVIYVPHFLDASAQHPLTQGAVGIGVLPRGQEVLVTVVELLGAHSPLELARLGLPPVLF